MVPPSTSGRPAAVAKCQRERGVETGLPCASRVAPPVTRTHPCTPPFVGVNGVRAEQVSMKSPPAARQVCARTARGAFPRAGSCGSARSIYCTARSVVFSPATAPATRRLACLLSASQAEAFDISASSEVALSARMSRETPESSVDFAPQPEYSRREFEANRFSRFSRLATAPGRATNPRFAD